MKTNIVHALISGIVIPLATLAGLLVVSIAKADQPSLPPNTDAVPGGVTVLSIPSALVPTKAAFNNKRVMIKKIGEEFYAVIGIPLSVQPGTHNLEVTSTSGKKQNLPFSVKPKAYATQHITIDNKRLVNPAAEDMPRIEADMKISRAAFATWSDLNDVPLHFIYPVQGRLSSPFGLLRYFNGEPKNPHSGLDIAALEGTPVLAPADGQVITVHDFFFNGKTVFIDHGQGLITMLCHLSQMDVKVGQMVKQGERIGAVGQTGRATGPHLHFTVSLNDTRIEPLLLLPEHTYQESNTEKTN